MVLSKAIATFSRAQVRWNSQFRPPNRTNDFRYFKLSALKQHTAVIPLVVIISTAVLATIQRKH
ncbi:CLUMA_CG011373, isoform A [Clunio marinus]|uniref:CLUMA_CG011373, isoform A n=1 Tax=Clunio marinus TaxID=568069 RepID=A0A1J1IEM3_9DIPT|nr:CLUMA_CG011373, isoform A [Clunio marinus]